MKKKHHGCGIKRITNPVLCLSKKARPSNPFTCGSGVYLRSSIMFNTHTARSTGLRTGHPDWHCPERQCVVRLGPAFAHCGHTRQPQVQTESSQPQSPGHRANRSDGAPRFPPTAQPGLRKKTYCHETCDVLTWTMRLEEFLGGCFSRITEPLKRDV